MNAIFIFLALHLHPANYPMLVTDQSEHRIMLMLVPSGELIREWRAADIPEAHRKWFRNPSEVKVSRDCKYILTCASGGGAAIIRLSDAKTLWYDSVGGNPHSLDIAPGNTLVVASSTGNQSTVFRYDTTSLYRPKRPRKTFKVPDGHAVNFYDYRFYISGSDKIFLYDYREDKRKDVADLAPAGSVQIPGHGAHDMIYGSRQDIFYLTTVDTLLEFHIKDNSFHPISGKTVRNIKSISEAPEGFPNIVTLPKEQWWTDEVQDLKGNTIIRLPGAKIYKARWLTGFKTSFTTISRNGEKQVKSW